MGVREAELRPDLRGRFGDHRRKQGRDDAQRFGRGVERFDPDCLASRRSAFGELPGRLFDDVFVHGADQAPDGFEALENSNFSKDSSAIAVTRERGLRDLRSRRATLGITPPRY